MTTTTTQNEVNETDEMGMINICADDVPWKSQFVSNSLAQCQLSKSKKEENQIVVTVTCYPSDRRHIVFRFNGLFIKFIIIIIDMPILIPSFSRHLNAQTNFG